MIVPKRFPILTIYAKYILLVNVVTISFRSSHFAVNYFPFFQQNEKRKNKKATKLLADGNRFNFTFVLIIQFLKHEMILIIS